MITNYIVFQLSNYNYNYFKNVINCNWLQLQTTTATNGCSCRSTASCMHL